LIAGAAAAVGVLATATALAQDCSRVERYAAVRSDEVNVRAGPGVKYPIDWVFIRKDMPVAVIAEFEHWRRVCDWEGTSGWIHQSMLATRPTVIITASLATLRHQPSATAPAVAHVAATVVGDLLECDADWCRINVQGYRGWVPKQAVWGPDRAE
jgi:SH3-like domain-containing protein